jgi:restriction endonuclease Mrr
VDGIIEQDSLGLGRIYFQAKRYAEGNTVGSGAIRDFFGRLNCFKATKGLFVTASTFSPPALNNGPTEQAHSAHRRRTAYTPDPSWRWLPD